MADFKPATSNDAAEADRIFQLNKWLKRNSSKSAMKINVSDPHSSSGGKSFLPLGSSPTLFTVNTLSPLGEEWKVNRAISDFSLLRTTLLSRYLGVAMPQLPSELTTIVDGLKKSKEARKVKQGDILNHFLRFVSRHPFLSQDDTFVLFLSHSDFNPQSFADMVKTVTGGAGSGASFLSKMFTRRGSKPQVSTTSATALNVDEYKSMDWWREAIELAVEPTDPVLLCKEVLSELERFKKRNTELKIAIRDFRDRLKQTSESCFLLQKQLQLCEETDAGSMANLYALQSAKFQRQGQYHQDMAIGSSATLLSAVREELLVLDAYKDQVLAVRDALAKEEEAKQYSQRKDRELSILEQEYSAERNRDGNFAFEDREEPKKLRAARKAKEDALGVLYATCHTASLMTRATLTIEINLFREERVFRTDLYFQEFANVHAQYSSNSLAIWGKSQGHDYGNSEERLVTWNDDIPWDMEVPRFVQVVFDFNPENEDEIEARVGDRGTAVPVDSDRQWLQLTLPSGSGFIPKDFVRLIGVVSPASTPNPPPPLRTYSSMESSSVLKDENVAYAHSMEMERMEEDIHRKEQLCIKQAEELDEVKLACEELKREMAKYKNLVDEIRVERDQAKEALAVLRAREDAVKRREDELALQLQELQEKLLQQQAAAEVSKEPEQQQATQKEPEQQQATRKEPEQQQATQKEPDQLQAAAAPLRFTKKPINDERELPPNWIKGFDPVRQRHFYHNTETKESIWKFPKTSSSSSSSKRKQEAKE